MHAPVIVSASARPSSQGRYGDDDEGVAGAPAGHPATTPTRPDPAPWPPGRRTRARPVRADGRHPRLSGLGHDDERERARRGCGAAGRHRTDPTGATVERSTPHRNASRPPPAPVTAFAARGYVSAGAFLAGEAMITEHPTLQSRSRI